MLSVGEGEEVKITVKRVSVREVKELVKNPFISAVGHQSTAQLLSQILGVPVQTNRIEVKLQPGQLLLVFQLLTRIPEGKVLSVSEIEELIKEGKVGFYLVQLSS